jgi:CubicO group peptidase (beta-lactamase class C family)
MKIPHYIQCLLHSFLVLFMFTFSIPTVSAAPAETDDYALLDSFITAQMDKHRIPGVALAVVSGSDIIYLKGYGTAGQHRPMTPQTPMYIGSQSKSFTGLAIAQLVEQGLIDLNSPVQTYIPWFQVADQDASQTITVSHLLHHISGLSDAGFLSILPNDATNEDAVRALASAKLTAPVGAKFQYFNLGYDVLAVIIQNVSGTPYEEYIQKYTLEPLGMARTYTDDRSLYSFVAPQNQPHRIFEVSAGYIISTAEDMAHYVIAMNNGGVYEGQKLLSPICYFHR